MKATTHCLLASQPPFYCPILRRPVPEFYALHRPITVPLTNSRRVVALSSASSTDHDGSCSRRAILIVPPLLAAAASQLFHPPVSSAVISPAPPVESAAPPPPPPVSTAPLPEEAITSRIYDATVIGEPMAIGKDKRKVWEKLMNARIVYLGEAEQVPTKDDKELELEIVKNLRKRCLESEREISLALEAFPLDLQDQLNQYKDKRLDAETLKSYVSHWPAQLWQEYEPLLNYCRDNAVRLIACGTPLKVLRTVQAEGISGLSKSERKLYTPPAGSGFISGFSSFSRRSTLDMYPPTQIVLLMQ